MYRSWYSIKILARACMGVRFATITCIVAATISQVGLPSRAAAWCEDLVPLKLFWGSQREDNFSTATINGANDAKAVNYSQVRVEGLVFPRSHPDTVPLKLYWSDARGDNYSTATSEGEGSAQAAGYRLIRTEGYVYPSARPNTVPIKLYWHPGREDNFTTSTSVGEQAALAAGYIFIRIEGYVYPPDNTVMCREFEMPLPQGASQQIPDPPVRSVPKILPDGSVPATGQVQQPLASEVAKMWRPGQQLRVRMTGGTPKVRSKVVQYAKEWTQHANIDFQFVDDSQPAEIKIDFNKDGRSWSTVGKDALSIPFNFSTMHFGWLDDDSSESEFGRVILHEFGHALGMIHEHQSPAAEINWNKEEVYADFAGMSPPWSRGDVDVNIFGKYSALSTNFSQYDPTSIMHYSIPSMWTTDGVGAPFNTILSVTDKQFVRRWYSFPTDSTGELRTGDDCDQINFTVAYRAVAEDRVRFELRPGLNRRGQLINWWKSIKVPVGGSQHIELQMQDGSSAVQDIGVVDLDRTRPIPFNKAKAFGVHTYTGYSWPIIPSLPGGSRVTLEWVNDRCN